VLRVPLARVPLHARVFFVVAVLCVAAHPSLATAMVVRVRWTPSADRDVVGYKVYTRQAGRSYGAPQRVHPPLAADHTMSYNVAGLTAGGTYYFAVSAYVANGAESDLSDELHVGPVNPCNTDRCYTPTACQFGPKPDGTPCSDSNVCMVCRTGVCTAAPLLAPVSGKLHLMTSDLGDRVRASGKSAAPGAVVPTTTGASVEFFDPAGTSRYRLDVPPDAFKANPAGTSFQIRRAFRGQFGSLHVHLRGGNLTVSVNELSPDIAAYVASGLTWVVRFGTDACLEADLSCEANGQTLSCR